MVAPFAHQWHAEPFEFGARVCRGNHSPTRPCEWVYLQPAEQQPVRVGWIVKDHRAHGPAGEVVECSWHGMPNRPLAEAVARLLTEDR